MLYITILVIAIITALTRFLPFIIFAKYIPKFITSLGIILPPSLIAMVFIYSCQHIIYDITSNPNITSSIDGIRGIIGICIVLFLHIVFKNILLSIIGGTLFYITLSNYEAFREYLSTIIPQSLII